MYSKTLGLALVRWVGSYHDVEARWLRWAQLTGALLPTPQEAVRHGQRQAEEAQRQAEEDQHRAAALEAQLARYREQFGAMPD